MIDRPLYVDKIMAYTDTPFVKVLTGVRRCGKSTVLKMIMEKLQQEHGIPSERIVSMRFDSMDYEDMTAKDMFKAVKERLNPTGRTYLFLDEVQEIEGWEKEREDILKDGKITHERSREYASYIMEAVVTNQPYKIGGNVRNDGYSENLPSDACVEVPCYIDGTGVHPTKVGKLPAHLAAMNASNIGVQLMTIEAAVTRDRKKIYQAAMLDPHTAAELNIHDIISMCDELIAAHGDYMKDYK